MNRYFLLCLPLLFVLVSCRADTPPNVSQDYGTPDRLPLAPDLGQPTCPPIDTLTSPTLDNGTVQTATQTPYPLRGAAPGAASLAISVGGAFFVGNVSTNGTFCVEVELQPNVPNTLQLIPRDSRGCPGRPLSATITHKTLPNQDAGVSPTLENRALNGGIQSNQDVDKGSLPQLNDGIETNGATLSMWDPLNDNVTWIRIDLGRSYLVSRVRIVWGNTAIADESYATKYAIALTDDENVKDPEQAGWTVPVQDSMAKPETQEVHFKPVRARTAALMLYEDGGTSYFGVETFSIAEIEVYGQDPNASPPILPDSCN
jgi:hypothetical protein